VETEQGYDATYDIAAALKDHGLDEAETASLMKALAIIHSEGMVDGFPEDWIHEAQAFGGYCATVGLVLGLDHSRRMTTRKRKAVGRSPDALEAVGLWE
jgi:hypothetical protein